MKLRPEPGVENGLDFSVDVAAKSVQAARVGPSEDASVGPFDVVAEDIPVLVDVAQKLRAGASDLTRRELTAATWGGDGEFHRVPSLVDVVEKLVAMMAPITNEISKRSLKPTELVLRRMLGNDRREEVFVEKSTLREKYEGLAPALRAHFAPLGFDPPTATPPPPAVSAGDSAEPTARAEIARS